MSSKDAAGRLSGGTSRGGRGDRRRGMWWRQQQLELRSTTSESEESTEAAAAPAEESSGGGETLTVGSDIPYPPFEQKATGGGYTGFDVELMEAIGKEIGREPEFIDSSFETIFRDVAQGKFEAVMSAATITEEREKVVSFSLPYYLSEQAILVKEGSSKSPASPTSRAKSSAPSRARPGSNSARKKPKRSELRPYPEGPDADQRAEGRDGRSGDHRRAGGRERGRRNRRHRNRRKSPDRRNVRDRGLARKTANCSNRSTKA